MITARRPWAGLAVLFLPTLVVAIDNTVLSFALPAISAALAPSATQLLWLVDAYPLVLAGLLVTMGTLGDRIGRRRTLLIGVSGFGLVSLAAAYANDAALLVAARALLGFFGAMLMPATLALLRTLFTDRAQRRLALAIWATGFAAGAAVGPIVGGVLLEHFWWGSVFLVNVPVMVALLVALPLLVPESRMAAPGRLDPPGVLLSLLALAPTALAVKLAAHDGITATAVLSLIVGVTAGVAFVRRSRRQAAAGQVPLLDVTLFSSRVLRLSALANATTMFAFTGLMFVGSQYLTLVLGLSPLDAGLVLLPGSVVTMAAGLLAARLARSFPLHVLVPSGLVLVAAGLAVAGTLGVASPAVVLGAAAVLIGAGIGLSETVTNDAILAAAPADRAGAASAVSETAYEIGAVFGTAVLGSVLAMVYRLSVDVPVAAGFVGGQQAHETLGGAVTVASHLQGAPATTLLTSARAAFVDGLHATSLAAVLVLAAVAVLVHRGLRPAHAAPAPAEVAAVSR
jgi:MFS transporter, DHA2 family, multidrug resistance protein